MANVEGTMIGATTSADSIVNDSISTWSTDYINALVNHAENLISAVDYDWAGSAATIFKNKIDENFKNGLKEAIVKSTESMLESSTATRQTFTELDANLADEINTKLNLM